MRCGVVCAWVSNCLHSPGTGLSKQTTEAVVLMVVFKSLSLQWLAASSCLFSPLERLSSARASQ